MNVTMKRKSWEPPTGIDELPENDKPIILMTKTIIDMRFTQGIMTLAPTSVPRAHVLNILFQL